MGSPPFPPSPSPFSLGPPFLLLINFSTAMKDPKGLAMRGKRFFVPSPKDFSPTSFPSLSLCSGGSETAKGGAASAVALFSFPPWWLFQADILDKYVYHRLHSKPSLPSSGFPFSSAPPSLVCAPSQRFWKKRCPGNGS